MTPRATPVRSLAILGTRGIPAHYGGFETFADELSTRLVAQGIDVTVFCESDGPRAPENYKGVRLEFVETPRLGSLTTVLYDVRCLWRARKRFDVVYMLGYGASAFCWLPRLHKREVWINMDGIEWAREKYNWIGKAYLRAMEGFAMRTPSRLIADAAAVKTNLADRHRSMPPCDVIAYGAPALHHRPDPALLAEWGLTPKGYHSVVCRFEPENHVTEIIEGYSASESPLPLIVLGDHTQPTEYVQRIRAAAARDPRVRLIGTVYERDRLQALRYHSVSYLHGHSVGGTNPSLLEALGCGNVVVAHDNPFNREVGGDAVLYFREAAELPALLQRIEESTALQRALSEQAVARIEARYTWGRIVGQYLELLGHPQRVEAPVEVPAARLPSHSGDGHRSAEPVLVIAEEAPRRA
ncbi:MAG: DUF1972 domain-containing protein [Bacteroidota bacterium]